jgi:transcriptional regulator with XRE-family HTH domain
MSKVGKNIKKIRSVKKMSQAEFAQLFQLARPSVGAYEEGRSEPKIETLIEIAKYFKISVDALLTKELTINELYKFDIFSATDKNKKTSKEETILRDKDSVKEETPLVLIESAMEYIVNHTKKDFINSLPSFQFPFTQFEKTRAFQVDGKEMEYENCGIHHQDILLCDRIKPEDTLEVGSIYVLVTNDAIRVRRLSNMEKNLTFKANDPSFDILHYSRNALLEIWKVRAYFSQRLEAPSRTEERLVLLEKKMSELLKRNPDR